MSSDWITQQALRQLTSPLIGLDGRPLRPSPKPRPIPATRTQVVYVYPQAWEEGEEGKLRQILMDRKTLFEYLGPDESVYDLYPHERHRKPTVAIRLHCPGDSWHWYGLLFDLMRDRLGPGFQLIDLIENAHNLPNEEI
jgi:hypothetical protein